MMSKRIIFVISAFILANCEIKVRESKAQSTDFSAYYNQEKIKIDEMEYFIFYVRYNTSQTGYAVSVTNLTKDKLEVEKNKLEIELLKRQLSDTLKTKKTKK